MGDGLKRARDAARATRGLPPETPKLGEIAERIAAHLARFEADPVLRETQNIYGPRTPIYRGAFAIVAGSRVRVGYLNGSYDISVCLTRSEALGYLAWLDAGGVGRHWEWERQQASVSKGESKS